MWFRPTSVYRFPRQALTLRPHLCMGIQHDARFPARSADALPAALYARFTQAIYRNRPITSKRLNVTLGDLTTCYTNCVPLHYVGVGATTRQTADAHGHAETSALLSTLARNEWLRI